MRKNIIILIFLFIWMSAGTASLLFAQNGEEEIRTMLEERDNEIKDLLGPSGSEYTQEQRDQLKDIINDVIDFQSMAQYALASHYDEITDEEREEFVSLFATVIRDQSLNRLDIYRANVTYNAIEANDAEGSARVQTTAEMEDVRTSVDYRMEKQEEEWVITDMSIDEVSTAESYRRQFQSIIRERGFEALLDSLRRRAARTA